MADCKFCDIVEGRGPAWIVYDDDDTIAFLDIHPATGGHTLVIPRRHARDLWELSETEARNVMTAAVRVAGQIRRVLAPDGLNLRHATGKAAGQEVFHFHLHVIPRYAGQPLHDSVPWPSATGSPDPAKLAVLAGQIRAAQSVND